MLLLHCNVSSAMCIQFLLTMDKLFYTKQRAVFYAAKQLNATAISKALSVEGLSYSPKSVSLLLRKLREGYSSKL